MAGRLNDEKMFHQPANHATTGWLLHHMGLLLVICEITFDSARVPGQKLPVLGYDEPSTCLLTRMCGLIVDNEIIQFQGAGLRLHLQGDCMGTGGERL